MSINGKKGTLVNPKYIIYARYAECCGRHFLKFLVTIIVLTAINFTLIVSTGFASEETRIHWISIEKLQRVIEEQEPVIVDLRTPAEFKRGGIPGAINIPIETLRSDRSVLDAYKDKPLLLYCRTVNKTDLALWLLEKRGFKSIYAFRGGYEAYRRR